MIRLLKINKRDKDSDQNTIVYIKLILFDKVKKLVDEITSLSDVRVTQIVMLLHTQQFS